ncbi:GNAT family N-acetyltransferase [Microbacterium invictum]|uniref:GNAT family N-acetyltransferase n=1 Tax=Microbacterium invictum TaxID=515415 RepID=A0ABZ0VBZ7_9MICO|nr:GNAT family N-acetyltransferase [Microbacterium invictum]WQB70881.1 GNAT family N-acetyltransferase [Microbacterium invictum]
MNFDAGLRPSAPASGRALNNRLARSTIGADARGVATSLRIRIADPHDAIQLAILKESWSNLDCPATEAELAEFAEELRRWMQERNDAVTCAVAELDGILIGMAWLVVFERVPDIYDTRRLTGDIQSVFVQQGHRSRGIGKQLVRALTATADALGIPQITVSANAPSAPMYEALGFRETPLLLERSARYSVDIDDHGELNDPQSSSCLTAKV